MSLCIKRLRGTAELLKFRTLIGRQDLPMKYLHAGFCYGLLKDNNLIAGYCLVHLPLDEMNTIQQIPQDFRKQLGNEDPFNYVEFAGYFLNTKKYAFRIKLHLVMKILMHDAAYVVYAYPTDQTQAEEFYRMGNPLRLYSGSPKRGSIPINVEILSKWGIGKICLFLLRKTISEKVMNHFRKQD